MIYEKLCELLSDQFGVDESDITPDTQIVDDLGADSRDMVDLISSLEDEFNLILSDERVRAIRSVRQIVEYIENQL